MLRQTGSFRSRIGISHRMIIRNVRPDRHVALRASSASYSLPHHRSCFSTASAGRSRKRRIPPKPIHVTAAEVKTGDALATNSPTTARSRGGHHRRGNLTATLASGEPDGGTIGDIDASLPYPKGQPWRVLWPRPHGDTSGSSPPSSSMRIPRLQDFRRAWAKYKETWEDGLSGSPSEAKKLAKRQADANILSVADANSSGPLSPQQQLQDVGDNVSRNLQTARHDAQEFLEHAKERTGIRNQDDVKALASEMMQIATEGIREFMAGYRQGRDEEIDKMLHEYFNDATKTGSADQGDNSGQADGKNSQGGTPRSHERSRKKRKPKRGIPRD